MLVNAHVKRVMTCVGHVLTNKGNGHEVHTPHVVRDSIKCIELDFCIKLMINMFTYNLIRLTLIVLNCNNKKIFIATHF